MTWVRESDFLDAHRMGNRTSALTNGYSRNFKEPLNNRITLLLK